MVVFLCKEEQFHNITLATMAFNLSEQRNVHKCQAGAERGEKKGGEEEGRGEEVNRKRVKRKKEGNRDHLPDIVKLIRILQLRQAKQP